MDALISKVAVACALTPLCIVAITTIAYLIKDLWRASRSPSFWTGNAGDEGEI
jgi:hypothetical protein